MYVSEITPVFSSKQKNRYRVRLIDGADFILYKKELAVYEIEDEKEITEETYRRLLEEIFIPRARERALHLLERQDRTEAGLRRKLRENGYLPEAIDIAIDYVKGYGYIDDKRYARNYISYKSKTKSKKRIIEELSGKGISKHVIEETLDEEGVSEAFDDRKIIKEYIRKKLSKLDNRDDKAKNRIYSGLLRRGFSSEDILSVMAEIWC